MAIEPALEPNPLSIIEAEEGPIDIEIIDPDVTTIEDGDGGLMIQFGEGELSDSEFSSNLAEFMDDSDLRMVSSDLCSAYEADKNSRKEWEETYTKGLDQLGLNIEDRTNPVSYTHLTLPTTPYV